MTAAAPLVERLAEVLARHRREFDNDCACSEYVLLDVPYEQHVARALLPVVEQAVAEARGEALREAAGGRFRLVEVEKMQQALDAAHDAGYQRARDDAAAGVRLGSCCVNVGTGACTCPPGVRTNWGTL